MLISTLHREDVLAQIRKVYGSAAAFERAHKFPEKSVNEVLRGRANARVQRAIEKLLSLGGRVESTECSVNTRKLANTHRKNVEAA